MSNERQTPRPEPVRSLAEIRGQYGLDEPFEVLAEGPRDRRAGTVVGRQQRAPAQKLVPVAQAVMGTARLDVPAEVQPRVDDPPQIPLYPLRWWPLLAGALITPVIIVAVMVRGSDTAERQPPRASAAVVPAPAPLRRPDPPAAEVESKDPAAAPTAAKRATSTPPSASASARSPARNALPDFPSLEDP